jgi:hypothetical protein
MLSVTKIIMKPVPTAVVLAAILSLSTAADAPCPRSFSPLEAHLTDLFRTFELPIFGTSYSCECNAVDDVTTDITCTIFYDADGMGTEFTNVETATLQQTDEGEFVPATTSWADEAFASWPGPYESFRFDINGELDGCVATECDSCEICMDGISIAIDCDSNNDSFLSITCEDQVSGAFMNTFDFNQELVWRMEQTTSIEEFCSEQIGQLEAHLTNEFALINTNSSMTAAYTCICTSSTDEPSTITTIDCSTDYIVTGGSGSNGEIIQLTLGDDGTYSVASISWFDTNYESSPGPQETYTFQDGALAGCEATGCTSCAVCDNGIHVAINCSSLGEEIGYAFTCQDRYMGAYGSSFDFAGIAAGDVATNFPDVTPDPTIPDESTPVPTTETPVEATLAPTSVSEAPDDADPTTTPASSSGAGICSAMSLLFFTTLAFIYFL